MKKMISVIFLALSTSASADVKWFDMYLCRGNVGALSQSLEVQSNEAGEFRAKATQSQLGVTRDSGWIAVRTSDDDLTGSTRFENRDTGFSVEILSAFGINMTGRRMGQVLRASFKDPQSGVAGALRAMSCR